MLEAGPPIQKPHQTKVVAVFNHSTLYTVDGTIHVMFRVVPVTLRYLDRAHVQGTDESSLMRDISTCAMQCEARRSSFVLLFFFDM